MTIPFTISNKELMSLVQGAFTGFVAAAVRVLVDVLSGKIYGPPQIWVDYR